MYKNLMIIFVVTFFIVGCGATISEEPGAIEGEDRLPVVTSTATAVEDDTNDVVEIEETSTPDDEEAMVETETPDDVELTPEPEEIEADDSDGRQVSEPVTVDLSQLTPEATVAGTPIVAPAPGIPNPLVQLVQDIKVDLSGRINIDVSAIEYVESEEVTWPDGSLGCPEPGMFYIQVLTPGYRIMMQAEGTQYAYHTRDTTHFVFCDRPSLQVPVPPDK